MFREAASQYDKLARPLDRDRCLAESAGAPAGSFYFDNQPNLLDQFLVNKNMVTGNAPIKVDPATVEVLKPPAMINPGVYPEPIPFGGMGKPVNQNGSSDHLAITMTVTGVG
jgi:hypothetical protein